MATPDGIVHRYAADGQHVAIANVDAVLSYAGARPARTVAQEIPTGGTHYVVRPHGPRTGTFEFGFFGADAETRAMGLDASLSTGAVHFLQSTAGASSFFFWRATGDITFERLHDTHGWGWKISATFTEITA